MAAKTNIPDSTLSILHDIDNLLSRIESSVTQIKLETVKIKESIDSFITELSDVGGPIGLTYSAINRFNLAAVPYTHDVELLRLLSNYTTDTIQFDPITINYEHYAIVATPKSMPKIGRDSNIKADCLYLECVWSVKISNLQEKDYTIRIFFTFSVAGDKDYLSFIQTNAPRFYDSALNPNDPLDELPIKERRQIREKIYEEITRKISSLSIPLQEIKFGEINLEIKPHTFTISNALILFVRDLPKRRQPLPLAPSLQEPYNMMLRMKKEHFELLLSNEATKQELSISNLNFQEGYIDLTFKAIARYSDSYNAVNYTITATIFVTYKLTIEQKTPTNLFLNLNMVGYSLFTYSLDIDNCPSFISDLIKSIVNDKIKDIIDERMQELRLRKVPFHDFSSIANLAKACIEPYGIQIWLNMHKL